MKRLLKGLGRFIFVVVPLIIIVAGLGILWLSRSLPPASGTVEVAGLAGPVTIGRDAYGIPHIEAGDRDDALAGLGFAHAQDRLWQMEVARMAGQGRLSEIFGARTLDTDIWLRTVGMSRAAEASFERYPPEARRALEAYARGVNAWLEREPRIFSPSLPPEFIALGHEPEPWRPQDSVVIVKMMSVGLAGNLDSEVSRLAMAREGLTGDEIDDLMPPLPDADAPPLPDIAALLGLETTTAETSPSVFYDPYEIARSGLTGEGLSNNWVISGSRTESGSPILANDPHLGLSAPSIWYLAHLRAGRRGETRNMVGATLAGAPLVLLGRNDDVAWGFTNTDADVQDLFVERVDPGDPGRYRTPDGWQAFDAQDETILVSGGDDHVFTRRATRHGPVMPSGYRGLDGLLPDNTVAALQWVALAEDDLTMVAGLNVWDVETVADFQSAMETFITPMQSIVIADRAGDIGFVAPGRVPVRNPENQMMGRAPVPGWDATYDWIGTVPYDALPRSSNPASGAIGTANTNIVDRDYEHFLTFDWDETYRQERLEALIHERDEEHTIATSRAAQLDRYSPAFAELMPAMLGAIETLPEDGRPDRFVTALLGDWDHTMAADRPEPLIAVAWLREAMRLIYADDLGDAFEGWFKARAGVMLATLSGRTERDWCDIRSTDDLDESCASVLADALSAALADLEARFGSDADEWRWGEAHMAVNEHLPFGRVPYLDSIFNIGVETAGGPFTLDRGQTSFTSTDDPFANRHAASFRAIYDLADLDASTYITTTGQSGNVFSVHYSDMNALWADGEGIEIPTDPAAYEPALEEAWQMVP